MPRRQRAKASEILAAAEIEARHFDLSELAHEFVAEFGGVKPFVAACIQEFRASKPGTIARYKLLDSMTRIIVRAAEKAKPQTEAGNLSDEELHEALVAELRRRKIVVDEEPEHAPEGSPPEPTTLPPEVPGEPGLRASLPGGPGAGHSTGGGEQT